MNKQYAVMHKTTGQLFAGFAADKSPLWTGDEKQARAMDKNAAHQQALLFASFGISAQKKPVLVAA